MLPTSCHHSVAWWTHACMHGSSMLGFATWSDEDMIGRASWLRWLHILMCSGLPGKPAVSPVWHCSEDTAALPWSVQTFVATQGMDPAIEKGALIHFCSCMLSTPHTCHADVRSCHAQVMSCRVMSCHVMIMSPEHSSITCPKTKRALF